MAARLALLEARLDETRVERGQVSVWDRESLFV